MVWFVSLGAAGWMEGILMLWWCYPFQVNAADSETNDSPILSFPSEMDG
jgi:hypothetical protein